MNFLCYYYVYFNKESSFVNLFVQKTITGKRGNFAKDE
jgi:hypothetical protein